ncbi:MAG: lipoate--protein ligase family protein [Chloroflexi bacterium]|nr:lipoate--protein ligase family protein [Chloroflexota bacterium]
MAEYHTATWRLLHTEPSDGATNMAVDEAILQAIAAGESLPTLRLYGWDPACLSLGRAQRVTDVDRHALSRDGVDLVRRPTGGRAILHIDELTYSVIAPETEERVAGGIMESYRRISTGLVRGLELLGIHDIVADQRVKRRETAGPVCFEIPVDYEITVHGRKLVGSAQMRSSGVVLQHGAVPLTGDISRICNYLSSQQDPGRVLARAVTVEVALGRIVTWDEVADALGRGFSEVLNLDLQPIELTQSERARAAELRGAKYATPDWNERM